MRHFVFFIILSFGASLAVRADEQGPVEKTGKTVEKAATKTGETVEHAATATGRTIKHGTQATERTVGKGLKKTGNTLEKAGGATTGSARHHARTKGTTAKTTPSPSPTPESSPAARLPQLQLQWNQCRLQLRLPLERQLRVSELHAEIALSRVI